MTSTPSAIEASFVSTMCSSKPGCSSTNLSRTMHAVSKLPESPLVKLRYTAGKPRSNASLSCASALSIRTRISSALKAIPCSSSICCAAAIELRDGSIVTGKNSRLLRSSAAAILNAVKRLAGIPDRLQLLPKTIVQSVFEMKANLLGRDHASNLNVEELLIALAISANGNTVAQLALEKIPELRDCEMHMTHITSPADAAGLRRLGIRVTSDPVFPDKSLHRRA